MVEEFAWIGVNGFRDIWLEIYPSSYFSLPIYCLHFSAESASLSLLHPRKLAFVVYQDSLYLF